MVQVVRSQIKYSGYLCLGAAIEQWIYLIEHHSCNDPQIFGVASKHLLVQSKAASNSWKHPAAYMSTGQLSSYISCEEQHTVCFVKSTNHGEGPGGLEKAFWYERLATSRQQGQRIGLKYNASLVWRWQRRIEDHFQISTRTLNERWSAWIHLH